PVVPHAGGVGNRGVDAVRGVGGLVHGGGKSFWGVRFDGRIRVGGVGKDHSSAGSPLGTGARLWPFSARGVNATCPLRRPDHSRVVGGRTGKERRSAGWRAPRPPSARVRRSRTGSGTPTVPTAGRVCPRSVSARAGR